MFVKITGLNTRQTVHSLLLVRFVGFAHDPPMLRRSTAGQGGDLSGSAPKEASAPHLASAVPDVWFTLGARSFGCCPVPAGSRIDSTWGQKHDGDL